MRDDDFEGGKLQQRYTFVFDNLSLKRFQYIAETI